MLNEQLLQPFFQLLHTQAGSSGKRAEKSSSLGHSRLQ